MTNLKIVSWNVNSVRIRTGLISEFIKINNPDIICLQETKVVDESFPFDEFYKMGYEFIEISGQKSYNGVAIISRIPLKNTQRIKFIPQEARHISVEVLDDIEIHNFYIPAGGDVADLSVAKFASKMNYLKSMQAYFSKKSVNSKLILLGDFNIAPNEHDVWSHKSLRNVVSHTEIEIDQLQMVKDSFPGTLIDLARDVPCLINHALINSDKHVDYNKIYSWWSYRNRDWVKSNRGRRLDHIWISNNLLENFNNLEVFTDARSWISPSDHVPVIGNFKDL